MLRKQPVTMSTPDFSGSGVSALVGTFDERGASIVCKKFNAESFNSEHIALDFYDRIIVKMQKPKGGNYVR